MKKKNEKMVAFYKDLRSRTPSFGVGHGGYPGGIYLSDGDIILPDGSIVNEREELEKFYKKYPEHRPL